MIGVGPHRGGLTLQGVQARARTGACRAASPSWPRAMAELSVAERLNPVGGPLRLGVLYDLLGRTRDSATAAAPPSSASSSAIMRTVRMRCGLAAMAKMLYLKAAPGRPDAGYRAARRVGRRCCTRSVIRSPISAFTGTARTSSRTPTCRGSRRRSSANSRCWCKAAAVAYSKMEPVLASNADQAIAQLLALRLAVIFHHARRAIEVPADRSESGPATVRFGVSPATWLKRHPLSAHLLDQEAPDGRRWACAGARRSNGDVSSRVGGETTIRRSLARRHDFQHSRRAVLARTVRQPPDRALAHGPVGFLSGQQERRDHSRSWVDVRQSVRVRASRAGCSRGKQCRIRWRIRRQFRHCP